MARLEQGGVDLAHGVMHCPSPPYHHTNTTYILRCPPYQYHVHPILSTVPISHTSYNLPSHIAHHTNIKHTTLHLLKLHPVPYIAL